MSAFVKACYLGVECYYTWYVYASVGLIYCVSMQQILVIPGGAAFETTAEYIEYLYAREVSLAEITGRDWKANLGTDLGPRYHVIRPVMPNSWNARYAEWKIWFDKIMPLLDDGVICVGHSLGGIFLAKYLSEAPCAIRIKALFLVAAPFNTATKHPLVDFNILNNLALLAQQVPKIFLYHSQDDHIVPFYNMLGYQVLLPQSIDRVFTDRKHFNGSEFPELVSDITRLAYDE